MRQFGTIMVGAAGLAAVMSLGSATVSAETTISAASGFPKGTYYSKRFEEFVPALNKAAKGQLNVIYRGGAPAIGSPFTLVQKLQKGIFGMVSITGAYYTNVMPESDAFKLTEVSITELRKNGGYAYIDKMHRDKGIKYVGRILDYVPFHLYLNKKISKPNLKGLHLRVAPIYTNFFKKLGASTQRSNIAQVYTYMENGTVVGFGWPIAGFLPDWHKVTKYRVDPGFYRSDIEVLVNLSLWNKLSKTQRGLIEATQLKFEARNDEWKADIAKARARQDKDGIRPITFSSADTKKWSKEAKDAGWAGLMRVSPKHGPKLKAFYTAK